MRSIQRLIGLCLIGYSCAVGASAITGAVDLGSISPIPVTTGSVAIHDVQGTLVGLAPIEAGEYSYDGLASGTYYARTAGTGHYDKLWNDIDCPQGECEVTSGTPIHVSEAPAVAGFVLWAGSKISGLVYVEGSGLPVTTGVVDIFHGDGRLVGSTDIDDGSYSYTGLAPGFYFARTRATGCFDELYYGISCPDGNCDVTTGFRLLVLFAPVTASFRLVSAGAIAGHVSVGGSGDAITTGSVHIYDAQGQALQSASISGDGMYSFVDLPAGIYYARTHGTGYLDELWSNVPCPQTDCQVTSGSPIVVSQATTIADFILDPGGSIHGRVTAEGSDAPVTKGSVYFYRSDSTALGNATIGPDGFFSYGGLASGTYYALTSATGHLDELWKDFPCPDTCVVTAGTQIGVPVQGPAWANFQLSEAEWIFENGFE